MQVARGANQNHSSVAVCAREILQLRLRGKTHHISVLATLGIVPRAISWQLAHRSGSKHFFLLHEHVPSQQLKSRLDSITRAHTHTCTRTQRKYPHRGASVVGNTPRQD
eukprot:3832590-Pleurochrysis_carterae.AAC.1